jgi:hypothetical protein
MKERSDKSVDKAAVDRRSFLSVALGTVLSLHWPAIFAARDKPSWCALRSFCSCRRAEEHTAKDFHYAGIRSISKIRLFTLPAN